MAFSLVAFGMAICIELREKSATIIGIVNGMDANLGGKERAAVQNGDKAQLEYFDNELCNRIKDLRSLFGEDSKPQCAAVQQ